MTDFAVFWSISAMLLVAALLFLLPPLLRGSRARADASSTLAVYRNQLAELDSDLAAGVLDRQQHAQASQELKARLLEDYASADGVPASTGGASGRYPALALGILMPVAAVALYMVLGTPAALSPAPSTAAQGVHHEVTPEQIVQMVENLAQRLDSEPDNLEGWLVLARSYAVLGRYQDSAAAYQRAAGLAPADAQLLADYADTLAMAQGKRLDGAPSEIIQRALAADARHPKALALAGSAAYQARDYAGARRYWERLLAVIPPESEYAQRVRANLDELRGLGAAASTAPAVEKSTSAGAAASIRGVLRVNPALAAKVAAQDTVFVFARAPAGPPMPLAVLRVKAARLPLAFTLDDSMSMTPALKLSQFAEVLVSARISKSGDASAQRGDLTVSALPVRLGARDVELVIDSEVP